MEEYDILEQYNLPQKAEMQYMQRNVLEEYNLPQKAEMWYYQQDILSRYNRKEEESWNVSSYWATHNYINAQPGNYYRRDGSWWFQLGNGHSLGGSSLTGNNRVFVEKSGGNIFIGPVGRFAEVPITNDELNLRASLSTLKRAEAGRSNAQLDYNAWNGGYVFTESSYEVNPAAYAMHPGKHPVTKRKAAGAYQFMEDVFREHCGREEFSPRNQDKAAVKNMTTNSYKAALSGNMNSFKTTTSGRWTSLDHWNSSQLQEVFEAYRANELRGESDIATPVGTLLSIRK